MRSKEEGERGRGGEGIERGRRIPEIHRMSRKHSGFCQTQHGLLLSSQAPGIMSQKGEERKEGREERRGGLGDEERERGEKERGYLFEFRFFLIQGLRARSARSPKVKLSSLLVCVFIDKE